MLDPLIVYRLHSGSLPREHVRDQYAGGSWAKFDEIVDRIGYPSHEQAPTRPIGFYFLKHEIIPHNAHGIHHFEGEEGKAVEEFEVSSPGCLIAELSSDLFFPACRTRHSTHEQFLSLSSSPSVCE